MNSPEAPKPETPQERFEWMKEWYSTAEKQGRLSGYFVPDFSKKPITTEALNAWGRKMNEKWVGDPRSKYHR